MLFVKGGTGWGSALKNQFMKYDVLAVSLVQALNVITGA